MIADFVAELVALVLKTDKAKKLSEKIPYIGEKDRLKNVFKEALTEFLNKNTDFSEEYFKLDLVKEEITKLIFLEPFNIELLYLEYCRFNKDQPDLKERFEGAINDFWNIYIDKASNKFKLPISKKIDNVHFVSIVDSKLDNLREQTLIEIRDMIQKKSKLEDKTESESRKEKFITEVSSIIELMGFKIEINKYIDEYLIDIYAEQKMGVFTHRLIIKCNASNSHVRKKEVFDFSNIVGNIQIPGYFISQKGYSKQAKELASRIRNIELFTYESLLNNLIDVSDYIKNLIYDYEHYEEYENGQRNPIIDILERANLYEYYIDLNCLDLNGIRYENMDKFIDKWLKDEKRYHLSILGDFGTGKSSFCLRLAYILAKKYKNDPINNRIPIFISLKDYATVLDVKQLITDLFINTYNIKIANFAIFKKMLENGKFILIFDGFDEMASRVDKTITMENFRKLEEAVVAKSKTILTCRTHYFKTQLEAESLLSDRTDTDTELMRKFRKKKNYEIIYVDEFNDEQIKRFLKRHSDRWDEILKTIQTVYNLQDLARRPILLDMIVKTITELKDLEEINAADLYRLYTNIWIQRDDWRSLMTPEGKMVFMEKLAAKMLLEGDKQAINYTELPIPIQEHFKEEIITKQDLDYYDSDTRTCSFLNRDREGNYKFVHKSFQEYFLAQLLTKELKENKPNLFKNFIYLPVEVYSFVDNMIHDFTPYFDMLLNWLKNNYFPAAIFIGNMGFQNMISDLCKVLSEDNYDEKTKYQATRGLERLHNSAVIPVYKYFFKWKEFEQSPVFF